MCNRIDCAANVKTQGVFIGMTPNFVLLKFDR